MLEEDKDKSIGSPPHWFHCLENKLVFIEIFKLTVSFLYYSTMCMDIIGVVFN